MRYYEVYIADNKYHNNTPLTYSSEERLEPRSVVTVPLRKRMVTAFVVEEVNKPSFSTRSIKTVVSSRPLPKHCFELSKWLKQYYITTFGEAFRQFAPSKPSIRLAKIKKAEQLASLPFEQLELKAPLTKDQTRTIDLIRKASSTTTLLHGATGTGKTRVYLELTKETLENGQSVILLTPEIALTAQLISAANSELASPVFVLHSQLSQAERKQIWLKVLESPNPVVIIGPRSALFSPVHKIGLIVLDEAHEPAYKQDQSPRYHAVRVASQLGHLTGAKVVLGTATPNIADYYLAEKHNAIAPMNQRAVSDSEDEGVKCEVIDLKDKKNFSVSTNMSDQMIDAIKTTLVAKKQVMIYLNRRGSARLILCNVCGWQLLCPNCDIPLIYHGDTHSVRCHICGFNQPPPSECANCQNPDVIYRSIGTKALAEEIQRLFADHKVQRFDSDNITGERVGDIYNRLRSGDIDILVGTQLLAKGLDLPKLGLVGIIAAESSLALPDYSSEERAFQLLYQVIGRVGRGHGKGEVVVQTYDPNSIVVQAAIARDYKRFYDYALTERKQFRFPPFSYLMQLSCRRATIAGAEQASKRLRENLSNLKLPVEIIGPSPSFYARRGKYYYWQLVIKSKRRDYLQRMAEKVPADWTINLDPLNLL